MLYPNFYIYCLSKICSFQNAVKIKTAPAPKSVKAFKVENAILKTELDTLKTKMDPMKIQFERSRGKGNNKKEEAGYQEFEYANQNTERIN